MTNLEDFIKLMEKEESRNYTILSDRLNFGDKKQSQLYELILNGQSDNPKELSKLIYGEVNENAYYRLKNLLITDIERSLTFLHQSKTPQNRFHSEMSLYYVYLDKAAYEYAFKKIISIEKEAIKNNQYSNLHTVYHEIISLSQTYQEIDTSIYVEKLRNLNAKEYKIQSANHNMIALTNTMLKSNFDSKSNIIGNLDKMLKQLKKLQAEVDVPELEFKIYEAVRNSLLQKKNYSGLFNYLVSSYKKFESKKYYNKDTHRYKLSCSFWLVNSSIKNKKLKEANKYLKEVEKNLMAYNKLLFNEANITYFKIGQSAYYTICNQLESAESILVEYLKLNSNVSINSKIFILLIISSTQYYQSKYTEANKTLTHLLEKEMYKNMDEATRLYMHIYEAIMMYDTRDIDFLKTTIAHISKQYQTLLKSEGYEKHKEFVEILKTLSKQISNSLKDEKTILKIEQFVAKNPVIEVSSNEILDYTIWCQALLNKEKYYTAYLKHLNT